MTNLYIFLVLLFTNFVTIMGWQCIYIGLQQNAILTKGVNIYLYILKCRKYVFMM